MYLVDAIVIFSISVFVWCWWYSISHCVPLVHRITTPSTVQVSANWKFRRFSDFPVQWENRSCSEAVTSWILPSSRCLLFSTFDVWVISNTRLPALLDGSCVRIKRRNRFLGSPRRGSGEPGAQRRSVSQCEPAPGATVASGARYFYFRLCPLAMAALEQAAVQMVENARTVKSVAPRCRAAKLVPPLSTPDQLTCQDQWDRRLLCGK